MRKPLHALKKRLRLPSPSMVIALVALFVAMGGGAYAITQVEKAKLNHSVGKNWGVITRNTIGSAVADLRAGPFGSFGVTGAARKPRFGNGSLGLQVSDNALSGGTPQEKVAFGNEVDFFGDPVGNPGPAPPASGLTRVGFRVFQPQENADISPGNMPNITLEINPHVAGKTYTSMVWVPDPAPVTNKWTGFINAATTGYWYFTNGSVATGTGCGPADNCTLAQAKQGLITGTDGSGTASIYTIAISKGRDNAWVGAVDGLRINGFVYDFEPYGVNKLTVP
jgi:hypothetical protein